MQILTGWNFHHLFTILSWGIEHDGKGSNEMGKEADFSSDTQTTFTNGADNATLHGVPIAIVSRHRDWAVYQKQCYQKHKLKKQGW